MNRRPQPVRRLDEDEDHRAAPPPAPDVRVKVRATVISHPLPDDLIELIARRFHVLADPTRIKLLERLRDREASVQELTETIGSTQQNVSKHLGVLRREGIVRRVKRGNYSYYSIADEGVLALCEDVCGGLAQQLESLREVVAGGVGR
jgi:DNA-binding transcriptional ArsR family regulator